MECAIHYGDTAMMIEIAKNDHYYLRLEKTIFGDVFVHVDIYQWSRSLYKEYLSIWVDVLEEVRAMGVPRLYSVIPADDDKNLRFDLMFGWDIHSYTQDETGADVILMVMEV